MQSTQQKNGFVVWITGLPASGKTTISKALEQVLQKQNKVVKIFDGDELRRLNPELGYTKTDRIKQTERAAQLASEFEKKGGVAIVALISPYEEARLNARKSCLNFYEVYLSTPIEVCIKRDPKGQYKKALNNELERFTGVSDPYEAPTNPELNIDTSQMPVDECVQKIYALLSDN